ncbi:hypothetical protein E2320_000119 [Naja naja]|nr:hypothetical protein E2320_000119 [Naja naja]
MFPRVENVKTTYFQTWAFPEDLAQGKSQNVHFHVPPGEKVENPLHFRVRAFLSSSPKAYLKMIGWKMFKITSFLIGFSLRSYPKAYLKILGRTLFSQNTYLDSELGFRKYFIFMFPGVENFENSLHFRNKAFPEDLSQGISQNVGRTQFRQKTLLLKQSSDFEKHFIFIFSMVENIKNPHHFRFWRARISKINSFSCSPAWKRLKIHFILGSGPSLSSSPKAYLKMIGWKSLSIPFMLGSELCVRSYCRAYLKILGRTPFNQKS